MKIDIFSVTALPNGPSRGDGRGHGPGVHDGHGALAVIRSSVPISSPTPESTLPQYDRSYVRPAVAKERSGVTRSCQT